LNTSLKFEALIKIQIIEKSQTNPHLQK
jgi:hypothetical protein